VRFLLLLVANTYHPARILDAYYRSSHLLILGIKQSGSLEGKTGGTAQPLRIPRMPVHCYNYA